MSSLSHAQRTLVTVVAALALATVGDAVAGADTPDLSASTFTCDPANRTTTRPGDEIVCKLQVRALMEYVDGVTADVAIPATTTWDPSAPGNEQGVGNDPVHPTSVHFDALQLGFMTPFFAKTVSLRLRIRDDAVPGDSVAPTATIHSLTAPVVTILATAPTVMPLPPDLSPSAMTCADTGPAPLRGGDIVECTIQLVNAASRETAVAVDTTASLSSGLVWTTGGNETSHTGTSVSWLPAALPLGVPAGPPSAPPLRFRSALPASMLGGTAIVFFGSASYTGAQSGTAGSVLLISPALVTAPGPSDLSRSTLTCADGNGGQLYPGDPIRCTATVTDSTGHEDVTGVQGSAPIPAGSTAGAGSSLDDAGAIRLPVSALGDIASGASKRATYDLQVAGDAAAGTTIVGTAEVHGTSVGLGTPISQLLRANALTVAARPAAAQPAAAASAPAGAPTATAVKPAASSKICASRRVVVVNVRPPKGQHWKSVTLAYATKKLRGTRVKGPIGYFRARLVFQGLPKGPITVKITGTTARGRTVRLKRTYNLCAKKR